MTDRQIRNDSPQMTEIEKELVRIAGEGNVFLSEPMSRHTTLRIGGPADILVTPEGERMLLEILSLLRAAGTPFAVVGNGSNLLVGDKGVRGVIVQLGKGFSGYTFEGCRVRAEAGVMLSLLGRTAGERSLTGMEFATGIPGTLGGAVLMNAGAYNSEMSRIVTSVRLVEEDGTLAEYSADRMAFGYRTSYAAKHACVILGAEISLEEGNPEDIRREMERLKNLRQEKQPLDLPSAGSTFKRPENAFAGKLIMEAGLRGCRIGGAQVSEKHCGFLVNRGGASAADFRALMKHVQQTVYEQSGIWLEPEVRMLGED